MGAFFTSLGNQLPGTLAQGLIWGVMALGLYLSFKILDFASGDIAVTFRAHNLDYSVNIGFFAE